MNTLALFKPINTFVFDVDGVLTNGTLLVMPNGLMARQMHVKDGYALQLAMKQGYNVVVISGGYSPEVNERLVKLGVTNIFMRIEDKWDCLQAYMQGKNLNASQMLFVGDDIPDYEVMLNVGLACCPKDAVSEIKGISKYISHYKGGEGVARDIIEKVLKIQGKWSIDTHIKSQ